MKKIFLLMGLLGSAPMLLAGVIDIDLIIDINIIAQNCSTGSTCSATIGKNAIGEVITIDVSKSKIGSWGKLGEEAIKFVKLPTEKRGATVYSFIPSQGDFAKEKRTIHVAFYNEPQRPGTALFGKHVIKILRRLEGEKKDQWTETGWLISPKAKDKMGFIVQPNGTLVAKVKPDATKPVETVEFTVGDKVIQGTAR